MISLTKHSEKLLYVKNYIASDETRPLMLAGPSDTGKSHILLEVTEFPSVNLVIINDGKTTFIPARTPSPILKILIHAKGTSVDYDFARYLGAVVIRFERDPECKRYF